jgi:hypothetical protein
MSDVFPIIRGRETMLSGQNHLFNHLDPLASGISRAKPDYYNGIRPTEIHPDVREELGPYIIPCNQRHRPALPNFFMEAKGPDGKASEAKRQITQDLACGARGMLKMQSYGQNEPVYDGNAYAYGSTIHNGHLQMYAMHPTEPAESDRKPEYHTTQIDTYGLTGNVDSCREGIGAWRNLQDLAKEYRDEAAARANETADQEEQPGSPLVDAYSISFTASQSTQNEPIFPGDTVHESDTSVDELAADYHPPAKRSKRRQPRRSKHETGRPRAQEEVES